MPAEKDITQGSQRSLMESHKKFEAFYVFHVVQKQENNKTASHD
jgi:hypothetical protein